jgi:hypothetical protein
MSPPFFDSLFRGNDEGQKLPFVIDLRASAALDDSFVEGGNPDPQFDRTMGVGLDHRAKICTVSGKTWTISSSSSVSPPPLLPRSAWQKNCVPCVHHIEEFTRARRGRRRWHGKGH